ncbi:butyrophilin subfamily 3 member A3-like [Python bivittatus]|uniref:Butyrophilin subfamily 3 member A3-like n=1 Tax=Python bivittatus TaxID=176946 RepID=A0A9F5J927_PYTBI|nr:butyrophilin subfamily 3 member A3-like [Python bivittatus]
MEANETEGQNCWEGVKQQEELEEALGLTYWESRLKADLQLKLFFFFLLFLLTANVILDPDTAHPCLTISKDHKSIEVREDLGDPSLPKNPERFENCQYVLGCQGFSTGRYFWEVNVGDKEVWAVGVVRKSVERKYWTDISPDAGIWEIQKVEGRYTASFSNKSLDLPQNARRIRVSLNCEGGQVTFFNAETAALLYRLSEALFAGETLLPSFYLGDNASLTLSP